MSSTALLLWMSRHLDGSLDELWRNMDLRLGAGLQILGLVVALKIDLVEHHARQVKVCRLDHVVLGQRVFGNVLLADDDREHDYGISLIADSAHFRNFSLLVSSFVE